ncbi:hypothetical protein OC844_004731 [Tilletia horrida]|nr:hypothetical protein OC844_004731 [Tilletia horrida]
MAPRPLRRPAHLPPLSALLAADKPSTGGSTVPLSASPHLVRPASVVLLVDEGEGEGGEACKWTKGVQIGKAPGNRSSKVVALVVKGIDAQKQQQQQQPVLPSATPSAYIARLSNIPPAFPTESTHKHFALPTFTLQHSIRDDLPAWLDALSLASQRQLIVELSLSDGSQDALADGDGEERDRLVALQHEQVEELLSKSFSRDFERWEKESSRSAETDAAPASSEGMSGARFVLDAFGAPPTHLASTHLLRSKQLQEWSGFCARLALHPRVYVKLSPPASSLPRGGGDAAEEGQGLETKGSLKAMDKEARAEFRRNVRIWIDALLDALGDERLIFAATGLDASQLPASTSASVPASTPAQPAEVVQAVGGDAEDDANDVAAALARETQEKAAREEAEAAKLTEVELWFELVREVLADIGIDSLAMSKIFETNALKLYGVDA